MQNVRHSVSKIFNCRKMIFICFNKFINSKVRKLTICNNNLFHLLLCNMCNSYSFIIVFGLKMLHRLDRRYDIFINFPVCFVLRIFVAARLLVLCTFPCDFCYRDLKVCLQNFVKSILPKLWVWKWRGVNRLTKVSSDFRLVK